MTAITPRLAALELTEKEEELVAACPNEQAAIQAVRGVRNTKERTQG